MTSGGIALKFFASLRLEVRPTGKIKSVSSIILSQHNLLYHLQPCCFPVSHLLKSISSFYIHRITCY